MNGVHPRICLGYLRGESEGGGIDSEFCREPEANDSKRDLGAGSTTQIITY
jgi:hypothetical protein